MKRYIKRSGVLFWLVPTLVLLVALTLIPLIWLLVLHWAGVAIGASGGLLALIGGVMGATFTVGGLIIALVSVYTQLSIEARITNSFETLQPKLDARASHQIEAYVAFLRARDAQDWQEALKYGQEAVKEWDGIEGVRSYIGQRLSEGIKTWFVTRILEAHSIPKLSLETMSGQYTPRSYPDLLIPADPIAFSHQEDLPSEEALYWLKDAIKHGEDTTGQLLAYVTLIYGFCGQFDKMLESLGKAFAVYKKSESFFRGSTQLALLAYACRRARQTQERLNQIGKRLEIRLPAGAEDVLNSLISCGIDSRNSWTTVQWVAIRRTQADTSDNIAHLSYLNFHVIANEQGRVAKVFWMTGTPDEMKASDWLPIQQAIEQLNKQFWFVCERNLWVLNEN